MKRRAGEREKELKVSSLCFLLPFSPQERAHGEPSYSRLLRGLWGCQGQSEPARAPAAPVLEPRVRGIRGRREVYGEGEAAQAPSYLPPLGSRGAAGGCLPAPPGRSAAALATGASGPSLCSGFERPAAAAPQAGALAGHGRGSGPFPRGFTVALVKRALCVK